MDINFLSAAKQADKLAKRSVKINRFLEGKFPTPSLFTQKGLENAILAQGKLKGGLMHQTDIKDNIDFMLKADRASFVDSHIGDLVATAETKEVANQIRTMKPDFEDHIESLYKRAQEAKRRLFPTKTQAKADKTAESIIEKVTQ